MHRKVAWKGKIVQKWTAALNHKRLLLFLKLLFEKDVFRLMTFRHIQIESDAAAAFCCTHFNWWPAPPAFSFLWKMMHKCKQTNRDRYDWTCTDCTVNYSWAWRCIFSIIASVFVIATVAPFASVNQFFVCTCSFCVCSELNKVYFLDLTSFHASFLRL